MPIKAKSADYAIDYRVDEQGRGRWYLTREGEKEPICYSVSKATLLDEAIRLSGGRGQIRVRNPKTGRWTVESR